jgi:hypothetical protein
LPAPSVIYYPVRVTVRAGLPAGRREAFRRDPSGDRFDEAMTRTKVLPPRLIVSREQPTRWARSMREAPGNDARAIVPRLDERLSNHRTTGSMKQSSGVEAGQRHGSHLYRAKFT